MKKFQKRVLKTVDNTASALLLGNGFGNLESISDIFDSVFVVDMQEPEIKRKNIIFREDRSRLETLGPITCVFVDLKRLNLLEELIPLLVKVRPTVFIEGNEPLDRSQSTTLFQNGFRPLEQQGFFHTWKKIV